MWPLCTLIMYLPPNSGRDAMTSLYRAHGQTLEVEPERDHAGAGLAERIGDGGLAAVLNAEEQASAAARAAGLAANRAGFVGRLEQRVDLFVRYARVQRFLML